MKILNTQWIRSFWSLMLRLCGCIDRSVSMDCLRTVFLEDLMRRPMRIQFALSGQGGSGLSAKLLGEKSEDLDPRPNNAIAVVS